jgi:5-methyltetrahydrofolate--homocysteine methyltransferase
MIIIGEKINATRKQVAAAIEAKDRKAIEELALSQQQATATYLDVNGGHPTREIEVVKWLLDIVQNTVDLPISLDSSNPKVILEGLKLVKRKPIINSISLEKDRLKQYLPIVTDHECGLIALLMSDAGVPTSIDDRKQRSEDLIGKLTDAGKKLNEIFVDPCFLAIYTEANAGLDVLEHIRWMRHRWPELHITGGVSNSSYGLPKRKWINQAYLMIAIAAGMDSVIIDPCIEGTVPLILAAEVVTGTDQMGMNYIEAGRAEKL